MAFYMNYEELKKIPEHLRKAVCQTLSPENIRDLLDQIIEAGKIKAQSDWDTERHAFTSTHGCPENCLHYSGFCLYAFDPRALRERLNHEEIMKQNTLVDYLRVAAKQKRGEGS